MAENLGQGDRRVGDKIAGTGQPGDDSWNRRWSEHGSKVRTGGTVKLWTRMQGEESRDRIGGEVSWDRKERTGSLEYDTMGRTAGEGQPGLGNCGRTAMTE